VSTTFKLEHPEAIYELTASSERALIYSNEPIANRILFIQEPEGLAQGVGSAALKSLRWEGRIRYDTVVSDGEEPVGKHIAKDGHSGLIVTTTRPIDEQLSNRMLRLETDDSTEQTKKILLAMAEAAASNRDEPELTQWHAVSKILGEPAQVKIQFAGYLAKSISPAALRIRRDFKHLLTMIEACTVAHRFQRSQDENGALIATVADYAMVRSLISDVFQSAQSEGITQADRKMIAAVIELTTPAGGQPGEKPVTQAEVREHLGISKSSTSYRIKRLLKLGYLANLELNKSKGMKLVAGVPLPGEVDPLPSACALTEFLVACGQHELVIGWIDPVTGEVHNCRDHFTNIDWKDYPLPFNRTLEPSFKSEPQLALDAKGFMPVEPIEPAAVLPERFNRVQTAMNPKESTIDLNLKKNWGSGVQLESDLTDFEVF
jgi:hypothetical protein